MSNHVIRRWAIRIVLLVVVILLTLLAIRIYYTQQGPKIELWHTFIPDDMDAAEIDKSDWGDYVKAETQLFDEVNTHVTGKFLSQIIHVTC